MFVVHVLYLLKRQGFPGHGSSSSMIDSAKNCAVFLGQSGRRQVSSVSCNIENVNHVMWALVVSTGFLLVIYIDYILYTMEGPNPLVWVILLSVHMPGHVINAFNISLNNKLVLIRHMYKALHEGTHPQSIRTKDQYSVFVMKHKVTPHNQVTHIN